MSGWEQVAVEVSPRLRRVAFLLVADADEADDVVAEAIARCVPHLQRGTAQDPVAYLVRSVVNVATSWRRRRAVQRRVFPLLRPAAPVPVEEHRVVARLAMVAALRGLPARQRAVLVLRYYEDFSEAEIAEALGISAGSVKTHASRGLAALRDLLDAAERSSR